MLTARESEEEQLEGLENGADNYITKPFLLKVLKAHMEALLRRNNRKRGEKIERGAVSYTHLRNSFIGWCVLLYCRWHCRT